MLFERTYSGFTLVEVMVSLVIFLVASMGLLPLLLTNMQAGQANGLHNKARHITSEVMAELQILDYANLEAVSGLELAVNNFAIQQQVDRDSPFAGQSRITVTTRWQHHNRTHSYQLQSIRSEP